ncbi:hypothetical protein D9757_014891 [Collybiopsis confluens]|uniref:F-box domain-containing protein n=1 Tax=Collybiopsis confluens TaxID=2823264 RepID=A0A8H5FN65_9AGAR|nr:hypothetical protein D9757_014891 [Collybiopsis confluens]
MLIRRFPNEIPLHIFTLCCAENDLAITESPWDRDGTGNALAISRVCALWRRLALSHSQLWSSFAVHLRNFYDSTRGKSGLQIFEEIAALVLLYLKRSKDLPLTLDISTDEETVSTGNNWLPISEHPALLPIVEASRRWKHLTYQGKKFFCDILARLEGMELPMLESVTFIGNTDDREAIPNTHMFRLAPRITRLSFRNITLRDNMITTWSSLADLKCDLSGWLWVVLHYCPSLTHLTIRRDEASPDFIQG